MSPRRLVVAAILFLGTVSCASDPLPPAPAAESFEGPFTERGAETGLDFVHFNGMSGELFFVEIFGPGVGLFDLEGDGDLDIYLPQGHMLGAGKSLSDATQPPAGNAPLTDRVYRNELIESGRLGFRDVTGETRIVGDGYGMGVAAGDYDGDGDVDLYVTNFGANRLLQNDGNGRFTDRTVEAGVEEERWSSGAAFADYDGDGHLDLFVLNYVNYSLAAHRPCLSRSGAPEYCGPNSYQPYADRLFRNRGDGTFADVSAASGIGLLPGAGLGLIPADLDGDRRLDFFVANDGMPNRLWIQQADGTFDDRALLAGCAYNLAGEAEASMGVDLADFDGDGDEDLFVTHLDDETNTLYRNDGRGWFDDRSVDSGLAEVSRAFTGFGTAWTDYDNDGWLDLLVANGAVKRLERLVLEGDPFPLHQPNLLFRNRGDGTFEELGRRAGPAFELSEVSRGAAVGDLDNDGDADVVVTNNGGPVRLLLNEAGSRRHWLGLRLLGAGSSAAIPGARVEVMRRSGPPLRRRSRIAASYLASNDPRVLVGLGDSAEVDFVRVDWPGGRAERFDEIPVDRYVELREGSGTEVR